MGTNWDFEAESVSQSLRDAMQGLGTDESSIATILGANSNDQLQEARTQYTAMFGRDLIEDLQSETGSYFEELCVALVRRRMEFLAHLVHDALSGAGTSEQVLSDVFATLHPWEVLALAEVYEAEFEHSMKDDISSDVSGYFNNFLTAVMSGGRSEDDADEGLAYEDAEKLYNAGEGTLGTDESAFMSILMTRSFAHLAAVFEAYNNMREGDDDKTLIGSIQSEFTGSEEAILVSIVKFALNPIGYWAELLRSCVEGVGTSERRLLYTVVRRSEIDLAEITQAYQDKYEENLAERITNEVGSDLGQLLGLLVIGNQE